MKTKSGEFRLSIAHLKIIETVFNLNQKGAYPTSEGVGKILNGIVDPETRVFEFSSTFATLLSYRGRKLCSLVTTLVRRGYLLYTFEDNDTQKYLTITNLGRATLKQGIKKDYLHKEKKIKKTILYK